MRFYDRFKGTYVTDPKYKYSHLKELGKPKLKAPTPEVKASRFAVAVESDNAYVAYIVKRVVADHGKGGPDGSDETFK